MKGNFGKGNNTSFSVHVRLNKAFIQVTVGQLSCFKQLGICEVQSSCNVICVFREALLVHLLKKPMRPGLVPACQTCPVVHSFISVTKLGNQSRQCQGQQQREKVPHGCPACFLKSKIIIRYLIFNQRNQSNLA